MKNKFKKIAYPLILFIAAGILIAYAAQYYNIGNNTQQTVNEWGTGGVVYNSCGPGIFVPTNTSGEINTFISKKPTCAKLCPLSTLYVTASTKCEATPSCSSGTYSGSINLCVVGSNYNAIPSHTFNLTSWCEGTNDGTREFNSFYIYDSNTIQFSNNYEGGDWSCYVKDLNGGIARAGTTFYAGYYWGNTFVYQSVASNQNGILIYTSSNGPSATLGWAEVATSIGNNLNCWNGTQGGVLGSYITASGNTITMRCTDWGPALSSTFTLLGTYTCPSGGTLSGTTCINSTTSSAICPTGTTINGTTDKCESIPK